MSGRFLDRLGRLGGLGLLYDTAAREVNGPLRDGGRALELVGGEQDGATGRPGPGEELVEKVTAVLVESRMRLVQQPKPRSARDEHGERGAALLSGGAPADGDRRETTCEAELLERRADRR
jgi:hypothetical protein